MLTGIRSKLSFANVTSCLALFIALGGTSYAVAALPRNSVGSAQLRSKSVGSSELKSNAVSSRAIKNGSIGSSDMSTEARASLRGSVGPAGPPGPAGVTLRAAIPSGGSVAAGNATRALHDGRTNVYTVEFPRDLNGCIPTATLATVQAGSTTNEPEAGRITVATSGATVVVKTYRADGTAAEQPFNVIVAC